MSIHPYFRVSDGKLDEVRDLCEQCISVAAQEPKCLYYGFSFSGNNLHCREGYDGAEGLIAHLANIGTLLNEVLKIAQITRLEVHGTAEELEKLAGPLSSLAPIYFTLEYGIRRSS